MVSIVSVHLSFSHPRLQDIKTLRGTRTPYVRLACDETFTGAIRSVCCADKRTNLRAAVSRSITRVKWHKRWCMRRQMTARVPLHRTITAVSLALSSSSSTPLSLSFTFLVSHGFVHLMISLTSRHDLQSRNEPQRAASSLICRRWSKERIPRG